jgi:hypothetical protein
MNRTAWSPQSRVRALALLASLSLAASTGCSSDREPPRASGGGEGLGGSGGVVAGAAGTSAGAAGVSSAAAGSGGAAAGSGGAAAGSGGMAGGSSDCHKPGVFGPLSTRLPCVLSETGLYAADMQTLAASVHPYAPTFELWADTASKKRWVMLPEGEKIDTSDMDYWTFPVGTKLWKEFARDGVRVETRLIEKQASGSWYAVAYQWRADQSEADAVPNGVVDASGTQHDIPNNDQCLTCHSQMPDKALGFSAIQLSHQKQDPSSSLEWTLADLISEGLLSHPPAAITAVPGTEIERKFFGYLHANCGHCHNPKGTANEQTGLDLWLKLEDLQGAVADFSVYRAILDTDIAWLDGERPRASKRIAPGSLADSAVYQRFIEKAATWSMPPLGAELVDPEGKKLMEDFITSLQ